MASKKSKTPKPDDKKAKKIEDHAPVEEAKEELVKEQVEEPVESLETEIQRSSVLPSPEPLYDEPTLTELIVESYEGNKDKGLYEGEGVAQFAGGHVYQGNFSEGMMHGHGVYTWVDGVVYEGDFFRNQVTGRGIYKWIDGTIYEGDVLNGIRHGIGTFVTPGSLSYTGDWAEGKRHGKGRMNYDADGSSYYEGDWHHNCRHGWGTRRYPSGNVYEGMWFRNQMHGDGTMRWLDRGEMYSGQWEDGVQHGVGQHVWFVRRIDNSQYPLRNLYDGEFVKGVRHGYGVFYYANGSRYEGTWMENTKHGEGKFTFKNGCIYEGMFELDHVVEFPEYAMDGTRTPDMEGIRTRTPLPADNMSVRSNESRNTIGPSFQVDVGTALDGMDVGFDKEEELRQVKFVILRYITILKKIYGYYSCLGFEESSDNTYIMIRMQLWRFLKDCRLHNFGISLCEMDRLCHAVNDNTFLHDPEEQILMRDFFNYLVILAYNIHGEAHSGPKPLLASCMSKLIEENILAYACLVKGYIYGETRKAVHSLVHFTQAYKVYLELCKPRKHAPQEPVLKMREFLFMLKCSSTGLSKAEALTHHCCWDKAADYGLVNADLTPQAVIDVLAHDDPNVCDEQGAINLEQETEECQEDGASPQPVATPVSSAHRISSPSVKQSDTPGRERAASMAKEKEKESTKDKEKDKETTKEKEKEKETVKEKEKGDKGHEGHRSVQSGSRRRQSGVLGPESKSDHRSKAHRQSVQAEPKPEPEPEPEPQAEPELAESEVAMQRPESGLPESVGVEEGAEEVELLDEETKLFNFWTHQLHIFFVRKFFPAAIKMATLKRMAAETLERKKLEAQLKKIQESQESVKAAEAELETMTDVQENMDFEGSEYTGTVASEIAVQG